MREVKNWMEFGGPTHNGLNRDSEYCTTYLFIKIGFPLFRPYTRCSRVPRQKVEFEPSASAGWQLLERNQRCLPKRTIVARVDLYTLTLSNIPYLRGNLAFPSIGDVEILGCNLVAYNRSIGYYAPSAGCRPKNHDRSRTPKPPHNVE